LGHHQFSGEQDLSRLVSVFWFSEKFGERKRHSVRRLSLDFVLAELCRKTDQSISLSVDAEKFREFKSNRYHPLTQSRRFLITELSFLQIFNAWEEFLEETFIHYMCGHKTQSGYSPILKVRLSEATLHQASVTVNQGKAYSDWSRSDEVMNRARIYFDKGEPFATAIENSYNMLEEMRKIRNGIAHSSTHSREKFSELVRQKIGYLPRNMGPGRFLLQDISGSGQTLLYNYGSLLKVLGRVIVH
jgi:hypothetical protein